MNLEVKEDDSSYDFTFTKYVNDTQTNITTATISIKNPAGTEFVASTSMSGTGSPTVTYTVDFSSDPSAGTWKVDRHYQAIMVIDGVTHIRLFDIVKFPFVNEVNIDHLRDENRDALDRIGYLVDGDAVSGTTTTLVDGTKTGEDTFLGGEIEIYPADPDERSTFHTITAFDDGTGTFTFSPARGTAVGTNRYTARRSFAEDIQRSSDLVKNQLWKKDQRAYLILDNTQVNNMVIYKFFERAFARRRKQISDDNSDHVQYMYYRDLYNSEFDGLPLMYDIDNDGLIQDDEQAIKEPIRLKR